MSEINNLSQEKINQKLSTSSETKKRKGILPIIAIICIFIVMIVAAVILLTPSTQETEQRNVVVTPDNVDEVLAEIEDTKVQMGQYEVIMNSTWEFDNGTSASTNAYVENSTANTNDVYFDVIRKDTNETIYQSPIIPIGSHLDEITLDTALSAGTYPCMLTYHLLDEDGQPTSRLNINIDIVIHN